MVDAPSLDDAIENLSGVGPRTADRLKRLRIERIRDLLFHLPSRYQDRTRLVPIGTLRPYAEAQVEGTIQLCDISYGRRRALLVQISDGSGTLLLRFFHFNRRQQQALAPGRTIRCFGEARYGPRALEFVHPEYRVFDAGSGPPVAETLTPIYPTTDGLHQASLRKLTDQALKLLAADTASRCDPVDALLVKLAGYDKAMPDLGSALRYVHRPPPDAPVVALQQRRHITQKRLSFEELLAHHLCLRRVRETMRSELAPKLAARTRLRERLLRSLPFELTSAQQRVIAEIDADLQRAQPMLRLLHGDVGAGKTVVAAAAAARVLDNDMQVAIMAPTELLAEQHRRNLSTWFEPLDVPIIWLSGRQTRTQRRQALEAIQRHERSVIIGTHALFQQAVEYQQLGLVIIDEQHRFGVDQRLALRDKGRVENLLPHQLIMTATPIPRTLAMTAYADLDVSVIDELPPNRTPVNTVVVPDSRRAEVVQGIAGACRDRRQVYWVCPLIEDSEALQCQSAIDTADALQEALPGVRVRLVHGRMKDADKDAAMRAFAAHEVDLLVATTVIEVGVDVPNASLMIIENAERLGLSQLHQLRGRVGRGRAVSDCVLLYRGPLSEMARARLQVVRATTDGFAIAQRDLELRGPGEVLGTRQAGAADYKIADLVADADLLTLVGEAAQRLVKGDPSLVDAIVRRWMGSRLEYGNV